VCDLRVPSVGEVKFLGSIARNRKIHVLQKGTNELHSFVDFRSASPVNIVFGPGVCEQSCTGRGVEEILVA